MQPIGMSISRWIEGKSNHSSQTGTQIDHIMLQSHSSLSLFVCVYKHDLSLHSCVYSYLLLNFNKMIDQWNEYDSMMYIHHIARYPNLAI